MIKDLSVYDIKKALKYKLNEHKENKNKELKANPSFIYNLDKKDVDHYTTKFGMNLRKITNKPVKKVCNIVTGAKIIRCKNNKNLNNDKYFEQLDVDYIPPERYMNRRLRRFNENIHGKKYIAFQMKLHNLRKLKAIWKHEHSNKNYFDAEPYDSTKKTDNIKVNDCNNVKVRVKNHTKRTVHMGVKNINNIKTNIINKFPKKEKKNNYIVVERYPKLEFNTPYIFVANHTCPEDIETNLNVLKKCAYLVLGSIECLRYDPEMIGSFITGMMPFDIKDPEQRKINYEKQKKNLAKCSNYVCPEGSHNGNANKIENHYYDGPVNLANETGKRIVLVTMLRDQETGIAYTDFSNPISIEELEEKVDKEFPDRKKEYVDGRVVYDKDYVHALSRHLRDQGATAAYYMMSRHFKPRKRSEFYNIEDDIREEKMKDAFAQLKWKHNVFGAEYLTKKMPEDKEYEATVDDLTNLVVSNPFAQDPETNRYWASREFELDRQDVPKQMRSYWERNTEEGKAYLKQKGNNREEVKDLFYKRSRA